MLQLYSPPYYRSMAAAVRAFIDYKFGAAGIYRGGATLSGWRNPTAATAETMEPSEAAHRGNHRLL